MRLVSLETTGDHLGICLAEDTSRGPRFSWIFQRRPLRQSDHVIPELDRLLKKKKLRGADVDVWAVDIGPGSFTGVRVGVATARALAQAFEKPLVGIDALEAMAARLAERSARSALIVSRRPALAGEVYGALYRHTPAAALESVIEPGWFTEDEFDRLVTKARARFSKSPVKSTSVPPHPEVIARLAWARLKKPSGAANRFDYNKVVPRYLQPSWAERERTRRAARS